MTKCKYKFANELIASDANIRIMMLRRPKQRYRTIIRAFYHQMKREGRLKDLNLPNRKAGKLRCKNIKY